MSRAQSIVTVSSLALLFVAWTLMPQPPAPVADDDPPGYTDTPFLPGGQWRVHDAQRPPPPIVRSESNASAPSDAVVLFDGSDLSAWTSGGDDARWAIVDGAAQVNGTGDIETREHFGDIQLHIEWATPSDTSSQSQGRGNSGVFLMGRYEVQVLDSFENRTYADGQAASMYGQYPPSVNVCRAPGLWQSYDILFRAPRFDGDDLLSPAQLTVLHNGVVVHLAREFLGKTSHKKLASYESHPATGPIKLQDHGNPVRFRNIWVRRLEQE